MINSNNRKLCLSGWLMENWHDTYNVPLRLQKFLLFYEAMSKVSGDAADFSYLKGYKRGPVFSNVWGDYTKERALFNETSRNAYINGSQSINVDRAKKSAFLVSTMAEDELSDLTHQMNLWSAKKSRILKGEYQVPLDEADFNDNDARIVSALEKMYDVEMIDSSEIVSAKEIYYVFDKEDFTRLTAQHMDVLEMLAETEELHNPVFASIDAEGRLLID